MSEALRVPYLSGLLLEPKYLVNGLLDILLLLRQQCNNLRRSIPGRTFARSSASGIILSASEEKSLSGLNSVPSAIVAAVGPS